MASGLARGGPAATGRWPAWERCLAPTTIPTALVPRDEAVAVAVRRLRGLRIGRTRASARGAGPRDPRAEGDRRRGAPHVSCAGRPVRRGRTRGLRAPTPACARGPRGPAVSRVPHAGARTPARRAGSSRGEGSGAAGAPWGGGGRTGSPRTGTSRRLRCAARVAGHRTVDGRRGGAPRLRRPGRGQRGRLPPSQYGRVGARGRATRARTSGCWSCWSRTVGSAGASSACLSWPA